MAVPTMYGGKAVADLNKVNVAAQPFHAPIVHVKVLKIVVKP